jgi:putative tricarboxylic transport membrane protein
MVHCGWPRPPLVIGFVLGKIAENNFYISTARYGFEWLHRPVVVLLIVLTLFVVVYPFFRFREKASSGDKATI